MAMPTGSAPSKGVMSAESAAAAGMPPSKQMQSEESLPALDDQERKAVQMRARERLTGKTVDSSRSGGGKTPKSSGSRVPGYMTPKTGGRSTTRRAGSQSSRSQALTNRTSSPTGRYHPDPERRLDIRQADLHANIDYLAPHGAPDNDRKAKESSWLVSQAFIEGLRYYPTDKVALDSNDSQATYSGNTLSKKVFTVEHMETDLRSRLSIAPQDHEWREDQCPREWVPEKRPSMVKHMQKVRERLKK
mmetsp:Transcript_47317/g.94360  ORF Transcript_47317/g.94360 Transcript_47317/m.94360 type:complete len:247 (-) Transcript_47317:490-1230(-)